MGIGGVVWGWEVWCGDWRYGVGREVCGVGRVGVVWCMYVGNT